MIKPDKLGALLFLLLGILCINSTSHAQETYIINGVIFNEAVYGPADDVKRIEPYNDWLDRCTDYANGYSIVYPSGMNLDVSLSGVCNVWENDDTRMEVYYDDFSNTQSNARDYIAYSNHFLRNTLDHWLQSEESLYINGMKVHLLRWERTKLARLPNDRNYYVSAEFVKNENEVYTLLIKSSKPIDYDREIIQSFITIDRQGTAHNHKAITASRTKRNAETEAYYHTYFNADSPLRWGIFEPSAPQRFTALQELESKVEYQFPVLLRYQGMEERFPLRALTNAYEQGRTVELTLQTVYSGEVNALWTADYQQRNARMVYDILEGRYDAYFNEYAQKMKEFGHPVLFRLNNEMNGDWCWYSAYYTSKDAELYKAVWRYLYAIFAQNGVDNVIWVWNPHDVSRPDFKWNHFMMYYPGDEYVDVIGMTGYNTGTYFKGETWREFSEIYLPLYAEYRTLFDKPFMITEFGSNSVGGSKENWINSMFDQIHQFPNIKVAVWWSGIDYDSSGQPGRIYKLDEDERILKVFHNRLQSSYGK